MGHCTSANVQTPPNFKRSSLWKQAQNYGKTNRAFTGALYAQRKCTSIASRILWTAPTVKAYCFPLLPDGSPLVERRSLHPTESINIGMSQNKTRIRRRQLEPNHSLALLSWKSKRVNTEKTAVTQSLSCSSSSLEYTYTSKLRRRFYN
jgi:hypothetical protein